MSCANLSRSTKLNHHIVQKESIKQEYLSWNTTWGLPHSALEEWPQLVSLGFFVCRLEGSHGLHDLLQSGVLSPFRSQWTLPRIPHYVRKLKHNCGWDQVLSGPTVGAKCSCRLNWSSVDSDGICSSLCCVGTRLRWNRRDPTCWLHFDD